MNFEDLGAVVQHLANHGFNPGLRVKRSRMNGVFVLGGKRFGVFVEECRHTWTMRIVQRAVRGDAHISQNLYALMIGVPIGNGPGRFTHFRQMIKKSPDLLLHPIWHEVHVQVNDAGGPQRLQVSGYGIVCQRRCDQWKLLYTKICECRHHSSDRVHSIMQWGTPVTVLPYQILAVCWTRGDCNTYCNTDPD